MKDGEQANEKMTKKAVLNTKDFEPAVIVKDIHYRLKKIKQKEFLETFYSPYIILKSNKDMDKFSAKDKEDLKDILLTINRRRAEIKVSTDAFTEPGISNEKMAYLMEIVRKNNRIIWLLKVDTSYPETSDEDHGDQGNPRE